MILECNCKHEYQDKRYGKNKRVHTEKKDPVRNGYICTVCAKTNVKSSGKKSDEVVTN